MVIRVKNRFFVSSIAFILLLLSLLLLIDIPALREIRLIAQQVDEERVRLEKLYVRGQLQKNVQNNLNKIRETVGFLDKTMLPEGQELQYITTLEQLASDANIDLTIAIGESTRLPQQTYSLLDFTFELAGTWEDMMYWIQNIETLDYYTNIEAITIAVREDEKNNNIRAGKLTLSAETYWIIPQ